MGYLETGLGRNADLALVNLIMLLITVAPLFSLPFIMKAIGGIAQTIGAVAQNRSKGLFDRTKNLGGKASNAQKGYYQRKGTEYAAKHYDARKGRVRNIPSMIAARKLGMTRDQQTVLGSAADKFERDKIERAQQYFSQMGIAGDKDQLKKQFETMKDPYDRIAAADLMGTAGGADMLETMFNNGTADERKLIAKAASTNKGVAQQHTGFSDQAKGYLESLNAGKSAGQAYQSSVSEKQKKTTAKFNASYIMGQKAKPEILESARKSLGDNQRYADTLEKAARDPATSSKFGKEHQRMLDELYSTHGATRRAEYFDGRTGAGSATP
jgi:hypothetical protein